MKLRCKEILFVLAILFVACNGLNKPKKPKNLIAEDKMLNILIDISLLNAAKGSNKKVLENNGILPEKYIYEKYDIDSIQFVLSNEYYAHNINKYHNIYTKVNDSLKVLKDIYEEREKEEEKIKKKKRDSLKKINKEIIKKDSLIPISTKQRIERLKPKAIEVKEALPDF